MFIVFNQRLAGYLMLKGFKLTGIGTNKNYNKLNVFKFENSDKLRETIEEYNNSKN